MKDFKTGRVVSDIDTLNFKVVTSYHNIFIFLTLYDSVWMLILYGTKGPIRIYNWGCSF